MERIRLASYVRSGPTVFGVPFAARKKASDALFLAASLAWSKDANFRKYHEKPTRAYFDEYVGEQLPEIRQIPAFAIDVRPVSAQEFLEFWHGAARCKIMNKAVEDDWFWHSYEMEIGDRLKEPVTGVTHEEASLFCIAHGGHLPSIGELFRIIRKGRVCRDLMDAGVCHGGRWFISGQATADTSSDTVQSKASGGSGVVIGQCDEWTRSPVFGEISDRDLRYQEYRILRVSSDSPFPLLEFGAGYSGRWWRQRQSALGHRYTNVGFRCAYQIDFKSLV